MEFGKAFLPPMSKPFRGRPSLILSLFMILTVMAQAQTFTKLHDFGGSGDGNNPLGIIAQGRDGNLYSTTAQSRFDVEGGIAFRITPEGILTVLHNFTGSEASRPEGGLTLGRDGNLYGTTASGSKAGAGTLFKVTQRGNYFKILNFPRDKSHPSMLTLGNTGNLFGLTRYGGNDDLGTVYKVTRKGKITSLHRFNGSDGNYPYSSLVQGVDENIYGVTANGGRHGDGSVFKVTTDKPPGKFTSLHEFKGSSDGAAPSALTFGEDGIFYGTAKDGGAAGAGVVFKITSSGAFKVLHNFGTEGSSPNGLVLASDGNFYGGTGSGGASRLYRITPNGEFTVLHEFSDLDGLLPNPLVQHTNGLLYGSTQYGGTNFEGTFFSLDVGLPPFVATVSAGAYIGKSVGIIGQGLAGTTNVAFEGTPAEFSVLSDTYLEAVVPTGAISGQVSVTTLTGALTSNRAFRVLPKIINFSPMEGSPGTPVIIAGMGLAQTNHVAFGGVNSDFTVDSDTRVTAIVPEGAPTYGWLRIRTVGGVAKTTQTFYVPR